MYTLVYLNGNLSRPDTLTFFLQSNVGNTPLLQIDCVTPFPGSAEELGSMTCEHLNRIDPMIMVNQVEIKNASTEMTKTSQLAHFAVIQIKIDKK